MDFLREAFSGKNRFVLRLATIAALGGFLFGYDTGIIGSAQLLVKKDLSASTFEVQAFVGALLLGNATYSLFVLASVGRSGTTVPELSITTAMLAAATALVFFAVFIHHAMRSMNASVVIRRIAADGHEAIEAPYPSGAAEAPAEPMNPEDLLARWRDEREHTEVRSPRAGYIAAVDARALVAWARDHDVFVEQRRAVGAFAVTGAVLAHIHHTPGAAPDPKPAADAFVLSEERVVEGDIAFPIRQLVDIALKGLSPGINDPTTAENAMDSATDTLVRFAICAPRAAEPGAGRRRRRPPGWWLAPPHSTTWCCSRSIRSGAMRPRDPRSRSACWSCSPTCATPRATPPQVWRSVARPGSSPSRPSNGPS